MPTLKYRNCRSRRGFTLVELLVVIAIIGILMGLLLPAVQQVRESARRVECLNNIRQLGIAVQAYESALRSLPPGWREFFYTVPQGDLDFRYGWATLISQYIEADNLYRTYDVRDQYWGGAFVPVPVGATEVYYYPATVPTIGYDPSTVIGIYTCPSDPAPDINVNWNLVNSDGDPVGLAKLNYGANGGIGRIGTGFNPTGAYGLTSEPFALDPNWMYPTSAGPRVSGAVNDAFGLFCCNSKVRFKDITDGTTNTVMFGERGGLDFNASDPANPVLRNETPNLLVRMGLPASVTAPNFPSGVVGLGGDGSAQVSMGPMLQPATVADRVSNSAGNEFAWQDYMINSTTDVDEDGLNSYSSGYSSAHPTGANFGFADGSHRLIAEQIDRLTFMQILQRNDGGIVDQSSF